MARSSSMDGLYVVTMEQADTARLCEQVDAALAAGARWLQYRNKDGSAALRHAQALALRALCERHGAGLIINDDLDLARSIAAQGVHLGRDDAALGHARKVLGPACIIGASCYGSVAAARAAVAAGADYVAFGSMFSSSTKPMAPGAPLSVFQEARAAGVGVPLVGIGGIDATNLTRLLDAGADAAAVIGSVFGGDPAADVVSRRTRALLHCFERSTHVQDAIER